MKQIGIFMLPLSGLIVYHRLPPSCSIRFASSHLYTRVVRGTVRVKCLSQEHNAVPRPGLKPRPFDPESSTVTIRSLHLTRLQSGFKQFIKWLHSRASGLSVTTSCVLFLSKFLLCAENFR